MKNMSAPGHSPHRPMCPRTQDCLLLVALLFLTSVSSDDSRGPLTNPWSPLTKQDLRTKRREQSSSMEGNHACQRGPHDQNSRPCHTLRLSSSLAGEVGESFIRPVVTRPRVAEDRKRRSWQSARFLWCQRQIPDPGYPAMFPVSALKLNEALKVSGNACNSIVVPLSAT